MQHVRARNVAPLAWGRAAKAARVRRRPRWLRSSGSVHEEIDPRDHIMHNPVSRPFDDRLSRVAAFAPATRHEALPETLAHDQLDAVTALGAEIGRNRYGEHLVCR